MEEGTKMVLCSLCDAIHSFDNINLGWLINRGFDDNIYFIKELIGMSSTILIFLSYLILRLRKAKIIK